jgi:hypothetical protein
MACLQGSNCKVFKELAVNAYLEDVASSGASKPVYDAGQSYKLRCVSLASFPAIGLAWSDNVINNVMAVGGLSSINEWQRPR